MKYNTAKIYGELFSAYSDKLFDESVDLFKLRHKKWNWDLDWFKGKKCLDVGCGGGRYLVALSELGADEAIGIDISKVAVEEANSRLLARGINPEKAKAEQGSALALPFPNNSFDYVVCSGVAHHTPSPYLVFSECTRVLKPGGKLWFSVYGEGGLKWLTNDIFRYTVCKIIPFKTLNNIFKKLRVPANKRYNILDNLYVNHIHRYKEEEVRHWFKLNRYTDVQRMKFERYDYSTLKSRLIHGEGWLSFYATKQ